MRSVFISLVCVFSLALAGCGDDSSDIVGTWVPDTDAMKAANEKVNPMAGAAMAGGMAAGGAAAGGVAAAEAALKMMPDGPQKDMLLKKMKEAEETAKKGMADPFSAFGGLTVNMKGDGTYARMVGGKERESGTWKLEGSKLIITPTEKDGTKQTAQNATYAGGRITIKPEGVGITFILKKK